jgi:uncharacterized metal-binding protein
MSNIQDQYSAEDIQIMRAAEETKTAGATRIEELRKYAKSTGVKRLGVGYCIAVSKEAQQLKSMLENDFEMVMVDCKCGRIEKSDLIGGDYSGLCCNPAGQADFLKENGTELNISFGLCMGHDIVFNQKSQAPVTTLIIKDRAHKHNPYKSFE